MVIDTVAVFIIAGGRRPVLAKSFAISGCRALTATNRRSMTHRPGTSAPWTCRDQTIRSPSVRPIADAIPIGIGLSSASRTAMDTATWWSNMQPIDLCETRVGRFGDWLGGPGTERRKQLAGTTPMCSAVEWAVLVALGVHGLRDLAAVIKAWDRLPEAIRAGIAAMVKAASMRVHPFLSSMADRQKRQPEAAT